MLFQHISRVIHSNNCQSGPGNIPVYCSFGITYAELRFGVENSSRVETDLERLERFLLPL